MASLHNIASARFALARALGQAEIQGYNACDPHSIDPGTHSSARWIPGAKDLVGGPGAKPLEVAGFYGILSTKSLLKLVEHYENVRPLFWIFLNLPCSSFFFSSHDFRAPCIFCHTSPVKSSTEHSYNLEQEKNNFCIYL